LASPLGTQSLSFLCSHDSFFSSSSPFSDVFFAILFPEVCHVLSLFFPSRQSRLVSLRSLLCENGAKKRGSLFGFLLFAFLYPSGTLDLFPYVLPTPFLSSFGTRAWRVSVSKVVVFSTQGTIFFLPRAIFSCPFLHPVWRTPSLPPCLQMKDCLFGVPFPPVDDFLPARLVLKLSLLLMRVLSTAKIEKARLLYLLSSPF